MAHNRITYACAHCGSNDVQWLAYARWSVDNQRLELSETVDQAYCGACDGRGIKKVSLNDEEQRKRQVWHDYYAYCEDKHELGEAPFTFAQWSEANRDCA